MEAHEGSDIVQKEKRKCPISSLFLILKLIQRKQKSEWVETRKEERENEIKKENERKMKEKKKRESHGHWAMGRREVRSLKRSKNNRVTAKTDNNDFDHISCYTKW